MAMCSEVLCLAEEGDRETVPCKSGYQSRPCMPGAAVSMQNFKILNLVL